MSGEDVEREWSLEELLAATREADLEELSVAMPGRVESYDAEAQVADVTPLVRRVISRDDGRIVTQQLATVRAVPVCWPRAGSWYLHMPLTAGDSVLLVCCDRDPSRWRSSGLVSDPPDRRTHHLAHAVAIPGVYPRTRELADTPTDELVLGYDGGATVRIKRIVTGEGTRYEIILDTLAEGLVRAGGPGADDPLSLSSRVDAVINAFLGATPVPNDGGAALQAATQIAWTAVGESTAATRVRGQ